MSFFTAVLLENPRAIFRTTVQWSDEFAISFIPLSNELKTCHNRNSFGDFRRYSIYSFPSEDGDARVVTVTRSDRVNIQCARADTVTEHCD